MCSDCVCFKILTDTTLKFLVGDQQEMGGL